MIRFSAVLVVVAVLVLIGGVATSTLLLVYVAIILSAAALIALAVGVALKRDELFGGAGRPVGSVMGTGASPSPFAGQPGAYPAGGHVGQAFTGQPASGTGSNTATAHWGAEAGPGPAGAPGATGVPGAFPGPAPAGQRPPAPASPPRGTARPGGPAGPATSRDAVTETRTDMTAIRADTPKTTDEQGGPRQPMGGQSGVGQAGPGQAGAAGHPPAADETRTDIPPVRPEEKEPGSSVGAPGAPGAPGAEETRFDLSPVLADETSLDLPAQSAAPGQPEAPARPAAPAGSTSGTSGASGSSGASSASGTSSASGAPGGKAPAGDSQVAVIPGVPRYHAPTCILIRFMDEEDLDKITLDEAKAAGYTPCTACQADTGSFRVAD